MKFAGSSSGASSDVEPRIAGGIPDVPRWVSEIMGAQSVRMLDGRFGTLRGLIEHVSDASRSLGLTTVRVIDIVSGTPAEFESAVEAAYLQAQAVSADTHAPFPIRIWNFVPGIHDDMGSGLDRYRVFNRGRYRGLSGWFSGPDRFSTQLPTATAVGHNGHDLVLHVLSAQNAGRAVENPRQCPAFRYSTKFGPLPPCFSRATVARVDGRESILIGGTASIRGEETMFEGSLHRQLDELFTNLTSLLNAANEAATEIKNPLAEIHGARIYYRNESDRALIEAEVARKLPLIDSAEWIRADICRRELLVEIEGIAHRPAAVAKSHTQTKGAR